MHGAENFKAKYKPLFDKFDKIYIHSDEDNGAKKFIEKILSIIPKEKCFKINSKVLRWQRPVRVTYKRSF